MGAAKEVHCVGGVYDGWTFEAVEDGSDLVWLGPFGADNYAYKRTKESIKGREVWQFDAKLSAEKERAKNPPSLIVPPQPNAEGGPTKLRVKHNDRLSRWEMYRGAQLVATREHLEDQEELRAWFKEVQEQQENAK